jgi:hypothetical protein
MKPTKVWVAVAPHGSPWPGSARFQRREVVSALKDEFAGTFTWAQLRKKGWTVEKAVIAPSDRKTDHG